MRRQNCSANKSKTIGLGKTVKSVKYMLNKHEDLSSVPGLT